MGVEKIIQENLLPCLFAAKTKTLSTVVGDLSTIPVNKSGLGLLNPVMSEQEKYLSSQQGSAELVQSMNRGGELSNAYHLRNLSEEICDGKKERESA